VRGRILIVDDEPLKRASLEAELTDDGFEVALAGDGEEALAVLERGPADIVVTDLRMPNMDGLALLKEVRRRWPETDVILVTAYGSVESAVEAIRRGAHDYLSKPLRYPELKHRLERLLELRAKTRENERLKARLEAEYRFGNVVGRSQAMQVVFERLRTIAETDATVLVFGETGTGKDMIANALHANGARRAGPFAKVSCAALNAGVIESELFGHEAGAFSGALKKKRGRFELANGGTLFLDEVDDIPLGLQVKLLRVLEEGTFERVGGEQTLGTDVRVVAATKVDLADLVRAKRFRADLYYRLNVVRVDLPPLRARGEDILHLAERFARSFAEARGKPVKELAPATLRALAAHSWPGNVRELAHAIERACLLAGGPTIEPGDLPETVRADSSASAGGAPAVRIEVPPGLERADLQDTLRRVEESLVRWALDKARGKQGRAAELLGVPRTTLRDRLERHGLIGPAAAANEHELDRDHDDDAPRA